MKLEAQIAVRLDIGMARRVREIAALEERSIAAVARRLLRDALAAREALS